MDWNATAVLGAAEHQLIRQWLETSFDAPGSELEWIAPRDYAPIKGGQVSSSNTTGTTPPYPVYWNSLSLWVQWLHERWCLLTRLVNPGRICAQCASSALPIPNPFVVPGGRFLESYYWDSYWILRGLLVSGLLDTASGILDNFVWLVNSVGFVPNGNRIYYTNRSQPPLLTAMIHDFVWAALRSSSMSDDELASSLKYRYLPALHREYAFWMLNRSISLPGGPAEGALEYRLNVYRVLNDQPRPESFLEDWLEGQSFANDSLRAWFYANIAAGAESGWDFSSRWFDSLSGGLRSIRVQALIPVDLNSILHGTEIQMTSFHKALMCYQSMNGSLVPPSLRDCLAQADREGRAVHGNDSRRRTHESWDSWRGLNLDMVTLLRDPQSAIHFNHSVMAGYFRSQARSRRWGMRRYLWNETCSLFVDYFLSYPHSMEPVGHRPCLHPETDPVFISSVFPIYTRAFLTKQDVHDVADRVGNLTSSPWATAAIDVDDLVRGMELLNTTFLSTFEGGIPASRQRSGQQWDFPNAWPPLQWIALEATRVLWEELDQQPDRQSVWARQSAVLIGRWLRTCFCGWHRFQGQVLHKRTTIAEYRRYVLREAYGRRRHRLHGFGTPFSRRSDEPAAGVNETRGMFEKYDVEHVGHPGGGGEYIVQDGFGWTNGVVLDWLSRFGGLQIARTKHQQSMTLSWQARQISAANLIDWEAEVGNHLQEDWFPGPMMNCPDRYGNWLNGTQVPDLLGPRSPGPLSSWITGAGIITGLLLAVCAVILFGYLIRQRLGTQRIWESDQEGSRDDWMWSWKSVGTGRNTRLRPYETLLSSPETLFQVDPESLEDNSTGGVTVVLLNTLPKM